MAKFKVRKSNKDTLARNIKELRKAKGWSQDRLAYEMGSDDKLQSLLSYIESGKSRPSVFLVLKIAQTLGTTVDYLCTHGKRKNRSGEHSSPMKRLEKLQPIEPIGGATNGNE